MAYVDFPDGLEGQKKRKAFFLSEEGLELIMGWRRQGISLERIATDYIGISKSAWYGWYRKSPELRKACAVSQDQANAQVERSLLKRACGYDWWEETHELIEGEMVLVRKVKRHVSPDTKALLHWLYNRMPNRWRAIQEPLESTEYRDTVKEILVAMKDVAEGEASKHIQVKEENS